MTRLPNPIQLAFDQGIVYFIDEHCEWKLEVEGSCSYVEEFVGLEVLVIGNNGCGDYLFLKVNDETRLPELPLCKFWHEGPEVDEIEEKLEGYFGLEKRGPSRGPIPRYFDGSSVSIDDIVEFKAFFRSRKGRVDYITGVSPLDHKCETVGIASIEVELPSGTTYSLVGVNEGHRLKETVRRINKG